MPHGLYLSQCHIFHVPFLVVFLTCIVALKDGTSTGNARQQNLRDEHRAGISTDTTICMYRYLWIASFTESEAK